MSIKVSVIIPVYNAEKYIAECIKSLLEQTLKECEFIFINDGSVDNSQIIIESFQDERIKLINQKNQGVSVARNNGLANAIGEYVGFVDADDYIERDMYERLYSNASDGNCDIVVSNFTSEMKGKSNISRYPFPVNRKLDKNYIQKTILPLLIRENSFNSVCNKIFRSKIINDNKVEFPKDIPLGEDGMFNLRFFIHASSLKYIEFAGYIYREVQGSATRNHIGKDYFSNELDYYFLELPDRCYELLGSAMINKLKGVKLVKSVMAYIHVYLAPTEDLSLIARLKYIKKMIDNKHVQQSLSIYYSEMKGNIGRYEKLILFLIKIKSIIGLYYATSYIRYRNS